MTAYQHDISQRTRWHYLKGYLIRWWSNLRYAYARSVARRHGATVGEGVVLPLSLARRANANLVVGSHTTIQTDQLDLRNPLHIGSHVIIGAGTEILTTSHYIDDPDFARKDYGITIEDYVWLPTRILVLPSCRRVGYGAVVGSGSVVVRDVEAMAVMSGNPAKQIATRHTVHTDLVVESLLGGDFDAYCAARKKS